MEVIREAIETPPIRARPRESNRGVIGYLRILGFPRGVGAQVRDAASQLIDEGARGIVLDLRGNPGGLLDEAIGRHVGLRSERRHPEHVELPPDPPGVRGGW